MSLTGVQRRRRLLENFPSESTIACLAVILISSALAAGVIHQATAVYLVLSAVLLLAISYQSPIAGMTLWFAGTVFVPSWTPIILSGYSIPPTAVLGIPILLTLIARGATAWNGIVWQDLCIAFALLAVAYFVILDHQPSYLLGGVALANVVPYVIGRVAANLISRVYLAIALITAIWGIVEFVFGVHLFTHWPSLPGNYWDDLQTRSGLTRSEASLGHAIAYGAFVVSGIPFAARLKRFSGVALIVLALGVLVSFSRGPLIAAVVTIVAASAVITLRRSRRRAILQISSVGLIAGAALVALYTSSSVGDLQTSTAIRQSQTSDYIGAVHWWGATSLSDVLATGTVQNGRAIIDNAALRLGLDYGWIVTAVFLLPLLYCAVRTLRGAREPAVIATAGQLPILLVTSFITQWQSLLFCLIGMAVAQGAARSTTASTQEEDPALPSHAMTTLQGERHA